MRTYETGAVRGSEHKPMQHLISVVFLRRLAGTLKEGLDKGYPAYNWMKGFPVEDVWDHLIEHLCQFLEGNVEEDHLGHAAFNLMCIIHFSETQPNLFDGMPPGCKAGMLKFLALAKSQTFAEVTPSDFPTYSYETVHHPDGRIEGRATILKTPSPSIQELEILTQKNAEQALLICRLRDEALELTEIVQKSWSPARFAKWLEEQQRDHNPCAEAYQHSEVTTFTSGWQSAFDHLIQKILQNPSS